ncbi:uncharacterized protein LOC131927630 [Physella acuta]|uniref:uncharacterized protein LOC131927630 n=1 Tax=Physella acuta TaxID=109671 RepID=UPI0027DC1B49|nr:uncharacterized protein LOC131927630 [Physella acuta]
MAEGSSLAIQSCDSVEDSAEILARLVTDVQKLLRRLSLESNDLFNCHLSKTETIDSSKLKTLFRDASNLLQKMESRVFEHVGAHAAVTARVPQGRQTSTEKDSGIISLDGTDINRISECDQMRPSPLNELQQQSQTKPKTALDELRNILSMEDEAPEEAPVEGAEKS